MYLKKKKKGKIGEGTVARKVLNNSKCERKGKGEKFFHYVSKSQKSEKVICMYNIYVRSTFSIWV